MLAKAAITLCMALFVSACGAVKTDNSQSTAIPAENTEIVKNTDIADNVTEEPSNVNNRYKHGEDINFENYTELPPKPKLQTEQVYVNKEAGYQLTFPEDWLGWFYIDDSNPKAIYLRFYGKSKTGTVLPFTGIDIEHGYYGLDMFMICAKSEIADFSIYDSHKLLGTAKGEEYYSGGYTSCITPSLIHPQDFWSDMTNDERELAASDWEKAESMNYDDVQKTFKALE